MKKALTLSAVASVGLIAQTSGFDLDFGAIGGAIADVVRSDIGQVIVKEVVKDVVPGGQ